MVPVGLTGKKKKAMFSHHSFSISSNYKTQIVAKEKIAASRVIVCTWITGVLVLTLWL